MPKNTIEDLRNHLFETLEALKDKDEPMDLDRARAVADVAKNIIESAKVEVQFLNVTGAARSTGFMPQPDAKELPAPSSPLHTHPQRRLKAAGGRE